ncbi:MAG: acetyl-CoA carboxylase biotin carboxyl carrier protein subunit [Actinobacteria bacterium]|nr:acetyl-CoA carboxylase biotin carboxyl carrier protein subunit [Actinomycetota bacterium]
MHATVLKVMVDLGIEVAAGDALMVLEAMKMETVVRATHAGTVAEINAAAGQTVAAGQILVTLS